MKKITLLALLISSIITAQTSISASLGAKLIKSDSRTVTLGYIDESPSRDNISTDFEQSGNLAIQASVRMQDTNPDKKGHWFGELQGFVGAVNGLALNVGAFRADYSNKGLRFQPEIGAVIGYCTKSIGEIENNDVYIQVNDTKFEDYSNVDASIQNIFFGLKPGVSFATKAGINSEIGLAINYQISIKSGSLGFSGKDQNGSSVTESEKLSEKNVAFYVDFEETDKVPFNPDGLEIKLFYTF